MKNKDNKHAENTSDQHRVSNDGKKAKAAAHTPIVNYKYTHELPMLSKNVKKCKTPTNRKSVKKCTKLLSRN